MIPSSVSEMAHTPGIYFALAYWMSCVFFIWPNPHRVKGWKLIAVLSGYLLSLPIHLLACWSYQKTDNAWTPMVSLGIANLLISVAQILLLQ